MLDYLGKEERIAAWAQIWVASEGEDDIFFMYGVNAIPATYMVGPEGKTVGRDMHDLGEDELVQKVTALVK